jgi:hypothetical protein
MIDSIYMRFWDNLMMIKIRTVVAWGRGGRECLGAGTDYKGFRGHFWGADILSR